jgi:hypothetical protein
VKNEFAGLPVLITGGASGIGHAVATAFSGRRLRQFVLRKGRPRHSGKQRWGQLSRNCRAGPTGGLGQGLRRERAGLCPRDPVRAALPSEVQGGPDSEHVLVHSDYRPAEPGALFRDQGAHRGHDPGHGRRSRVRGHPCRREADDRPFAHHAGSRLPRCGHPCLVDQPN